jgi:glycosyltransferase 2 family protein
LRKYKNDFIHLFEHTNGLLQVWPLIVTIGLSLFSCFTECLPLCLLLRTIHYDTTLANSIFIVRSSTIAATLSMIPGGIGVIEGSVVGFLMYTGLNKSSAVSVSLLERLVVLWFGVIIGLMVLFIQRKYYIKVQLHPNLRRNENERNYFGRRDRIQIIPANESNQ